MIEALQSKVSESRKQSSNDDPANCGEQDDATVQEDLIQECEDEGEFD